MCIYEVECINGPVLVSRGMMVRICQEGHLLKRILFGRDDIDSDKDIVVLTAISRHVTKQALTCLLHSIRMNCVYLVYEFRHELEAIGGFKCLDKYHKQIVSSEY